MTRFLIRFFTWLEKLFTKWSIISLFMTPKGQKVMGFFGRNFALLMLVFSFLFFFLFPLSTGSSPQLPLSMMWLLAIMTWLLHMIVNSGRDDRKYRIRGTWVSAVAFCIGMFLYLDLIFIRDFDHEEIDPSQYVSCEIGGQIVFDLDNDWNNAAFRKKDIKYDDGNPVKLYRVGKTDIFVIKNTRRVVAKSDLMKDYAYQK